LEVTISLTIACRPYDRVVAFLTGAVRVEGCDVNFLPLQAEEIFHRAYARAEFDVTELSMSSHIVTTEMQTSAYVGLPVFISRMFRHSAIYVRADRKITDPTHLRGKVLGVPEYQMTAALWVRGMLSDIYGVKAEQIAWRTGGLHRPGRQEKFNLTFPAQFDVQPIPSDTTLNALLENGVLDGIVSARPPRCFLSGSVAVRRLFPDFVEKEREYYLQTSLFPIMHLIGVRRSLLDRYPWLASSLFKAFSEAKASCVAAVEDDNALQIMLPWSLWDYAQTMELMGHDYWPYGVTKNAKVLETMLRYSGEQGLTRKSMKVAGLFAPCEEEKAGA
jgi:4,5-dihydroxyphthalate decarboxylase